MSCSRRPWFLCDYDPHEIVDCNGVTVCRCPSQYDAAFILELLKWTRESSQEILANRIESRILASNIDELSKGNL